MSSSYGENLKLTIFGQSHSPAIGVTIEGIPAGERIDFEELAAFLRRRAPGQNAWSTARKEADAPEFLSGLVGNTTCGTPLTAVIRNSDTRSKDYSNLTVTPRPGHADYTASVKYFGAQDYAGGGHFSGRLTAPLCVAGGICLQLLKHEGITVISRIASIGGIADEGELTATTAEKDFPTVDTARGERMRAATVLWYLSGLHMANANAWYAVAITFFYLAFINCAIWIKYCTCSSFFTIYKISFIYNPI